MSSRRGKQLTANLVVAFAFVLLLTIHLPTAYATEYTFGNTNMEGSNNDPSNTLHAGRFLCGTAGTLTSIKCYFNTAAGNAKCAIYSDAAGPYPGTLLGYSSSQAVTSGWNTFTLAPTVALSANTYYWLVQWGGTGCAYTRLAATGGTSVFYSQTYGNFPNTFPSGAGSRSWLYSIYGSCTTGPDFSINASPTSQTVGAGSTAVFTLNLDALGGFSGTVSLSVTSGAPPGVTCTITPDTISTFPGTATLSVPTLITTSGTYSIVVTGTCASPSITHTVTVTLTVSGPVSYSFNVKAGATQIVVTLTYSWTGSGAPPLGSIAIAGPGGTPTLQESAAVTYDRTSISVSGTTTTYSIIHRATFTITAPGSTQTWTALISISGVSNYNVAVEVS